MWERRIIHPGLKAYRVVRGSTREDVDTKAQLQLAAWENKWARIQQAEAKQRQREQLAAKAYDAKQWANERTKEAQQNLQALATLLVSSIELDHTLDWSRMKHNEPYPVARPVRPKAEAIPQPPAEPNPAAGHFQPQLTWLDRIVPLFAIQKRRWARERLEHAQQQYREEYSRWEMLKGQIEQRDADKMRDYERTDAEWRRAEAQYLNERTAHNNNVDDLRGRYFARDPAALDEYWTKVLLESEYPETFPRDFTFDYLLTSRTLIVEYGVPDIPALPTLKELKYVATRGEFQEVLVSAAQLNRTYDDVLYQIALRTIYELFQSDAADLLGTIVFNGWVTSIDKATGQQFTSCILSVQATKDEFLQINLAQVEPKACFRKLKGISGSKLAEMSAVRPVLHLNKEDKRFVSAHDVAETLDDSTNLAAMDWLDFENLIREVFEKEFSKNGGEVKITRASRDGGVDAMAFDPDPIRGGKIVIQAKRYTNPVSVSAVRDLYGTVVNEGATKGILVTTADYGPDAYEFAKDKPLTLLSGPELLYLLQKHGHRARIDLMEAKRIAAELERVEKAAQG